VAVQRIGVLGGTFDPVHIGHLVMASEMKYALRLDDVLLVPAGNPPHKPDQVLTPAAHRITMLERAIAGRPGYRIDPIEIDRAGSSYTFETLGILQDRNHGSELVFLMGEDSLRDLHTWRHPERIVALAEIGVGCRPGIELDLAHVYEHLPIARDRVTLVDMPLIEVSSRDIRQRVATGSPIAFHVPEAVELYIETMGLYRETVSQ